MGKTQLFQISLIVKQIIEAVLNYVFSNLLQKINQEQSKEFKDSL
jgi:hypothetical protein